MTYSSLVSAIRNRVPSGYRDQSEAALITCRPDKYSPSALRRPLPPSRWVYAVVRTFGMRRPLVRVGFDCVAQPTIKQAAAPASVRLRHLRICNRALNSSPRSEGQGIIYKNSLGLLDLGDSLGV